VNADILSPVAGVVVAAIAVPWFIAIGRIHAGKPLLAFESRRHVPWGIVAVILSFLLLLVGQAAAADIFGPQADAAPSVDQTIDFLTATGAATLAATLLSALVIMILCGATWPDLGLSLNHIGRDIAIGVGAFLILGPLAFGIQAFFVYQLEIESHHPLIELVKADPTNELFTIVAAVAVLVAPMAEEYFFRVLFQGWLERHFLLGRSRKDSEVDEFDGVQQAVPVEVSENEDQPYAYRKFMPLSEENAQLDPEYDISASGGGFAPTLVPILCSAAFFAVMHWSHGPDPAALFVLAIGLGYVYQRTHRWLPCVITHLCLNATTMLMLWVGMKQLAE
jgi:membrane protease YdiL (CAAX protease family)